MAKNLDRDDPSTQRLDKWLWAARFYKKRSLASDAVSGGKVQVEGQRVKPARPIGVGTTVRIRKGPDEFEVVVKGLSGRRGSAPQAQALYEETAESIARRATDSERRRLDHQERILDGGRPTKRDRRSLLRLKRG